MSVISVPVFAGDPILKTDFVKEMLRQIRALDSYGQYDGQPAESLLAPLILTRERKAENFSIHTASTNTRKLIVRVLHPAGRCESAPNQKRGPGRSCAPERCRCDHKYVGE